MLCKRIMYARNNPARIVACMHLAVLDAFGNAHVCECVHRTVLSHVRSVRLERFSSVLVLYVRQPPNDSLVNNMFTCILCYVFEHL